MSLAKEHRNWSVWDKGSPYSRSKEKWSLVSVFRFKRDACHFAHSIWLNGLQATISPYGKKTPDGDELDLVSLEKYL